MKSHELGDEFWTDPATREALASWIRAGLAEDRADDDVTTLGLLGDRRDEPAIATITAGERGVLCGCAAAVAVFESLDAQSAVLTEKLDGALVEPGEVVLQVRGGALPLLTGERTALNIFGHLSGIATTTARWVAKAGGTSVLDTRKTIPGLRLFQKRAVAAGGGTNHRFDLAEFPLVKENHRDLFGSGGADEVATIVERLRAFRPGLPVQIEVEDLPSFLAAIGAGAERILLDNQTPEEIARWIEVAEGEGLSFDRGGFEASGGITGDTIAAYAQCGVGRVSLGALTHSVRALDLSLHVAWAD